MYSFCQSYWFSTILKLPEPSRLLVEKHKTTSSLQDTFLAVVLTKQGKALTNWQSWSCSHLCYFFFQLAWYFVSTRVFFTLKSIIVLFLHISKLPKTSEQQAWVLEMPGVVTMQLGNVAMVVIYSTEWLGAIVYKTQLWPTRIMLMNLMRLKQIKGCDDKQYKVKRYREQ